MDHNCHAHSLSHLLVISLGGVVLICGGKNPDTTKHLGCNGSPDSFSLNPIFHLVWLGQEDVKFCDRGQPYKVFVSIYIIHWNILGGGEIRLH